jgi:hypothetical protein
MKRLAFAPLTALAIGIATPAFATLSEPTTQSVRTFENGFCAGISWITLRPGETVTMDEGPDFYVFRVAGPADESWGVYSGNASQVSSADRREIVRRNGVTISAATENGEFRGYLAANSQGWQNHFFGSVFDGSTRDIAFFDRVDFSAAGQAKCDSHRARP